MPGDMVGRHGRITGQIADQSFPGGIEATSIDSGCARGP